jgi:hypothetical protein
MPALINAITSITRPWKPKLADLHDRLEPFDFGIICGFGKMVSLQVKEQCRRAAVLPFPAALPQYTHAKLLG